MPDMARLQDFGMETAKGLTETLTSLLARDVSVTFSNVVDSETAAVSSFDSSQLIASLNGSGGLDGPGLLLLKEKDSSVIADLLIGQDGTSAPEKMTELHLSAFGEVIHQMVEIFTQAAKKMAGPKAHWEVVGVNAFEPTRVGSELSQLGTSLKMFSFGVLVQGLLAGDLLFCLPEPVADRISSGAGKPVATPAGQVQSGVSSVNTQKRAGGAVMQPLENEFSGSSRPTGGNIGLLLDVPLKLTVELGRTTKLVKEILALAPGSVVELDKLAGEAVDILVNEKLIAKGEVVVIDENFGVRITEIINPEERLTAVQA